MRNFIKIMTYGILIVNLGNRNKGSFFLSFFLIIIVGAQEEPRMRCRWGWRGKVEMRWSLGEVSFWEMGVRVRWQFLFRWTKRGDLILFAFSFHFFSIYLFLLFSMFYTSKLNTILKFLESIEYLFIFFKKIICEISN